MWDLAAHLDLLVVAGRVERHPFVSMEIAPLLLVLDPDHSVNGGTDIVEPEAPVKLARVSERAKAKAAGKRTPDGCRFRVSLRADLGTLTLTEVKIPGSPDHAFPLLPTPSKLQGCAFEPLEIDPAQDVAMQVAGWIRRNWPLAPWFAKASCLSLE